MDKCVSTTEVGNRCRNLAEAGNPNCWLHGGVPLEEMQRRRHEHAKKGAAARWANRPAPSDTLPAKRTSCKLRTTDDLLSEHERSLVEVENSGGDVSTRVTAKTKVLAEARAVLATRVVEKENEQLREFLVERHPELRAKLRAVK